MIEDNGKSECVLNNIKARLSSSSLKLKSLTHKIIIMIIIMIKFIVFHLRQGLC